MRATGNLKNATMKNGPLFIFLITVMVSCNTKQPGKTVSTIDTTGFAITADTAKIIKDSHYFWSTDVDQKEVLMMIRNRPIPADSLTAPNMIQLLNNLYPEILLHYTKVSNDSIFISINKSTYLTEQIGSSGADAYLAEVTYNLTEIKGINFVDIRFKAGDHASPATYSRTDFVQVRN